MTEKIIRLELGEVQETLLLPLWARAKESEKKNPIVFDPYARDIVASIDYDFSKFETGEIANHQMVWSVRALCFDNSVKDFLAQYSHAAVINFGPGLDTTFQRVDNGNVLWINIDLPDVVALRQKLIPDSEREITIAKSILDFTWIDDISLLIKNRAIMFMAAGVFMYFEAQELEALFTKLAATYPSAHLVFDAMTAMAVRMTNWAIMKKGGVYTSVRLKWHLKEASHLKKWVDTIQIVEEYSMFSKVEPGEDWSKKLARDFKIAKFLRLLNIYKMIHVQF